MGFNKESILISSGRGFFTSTGGRRDYQRHWYTALHRDSCPPDISSCVYQLRGVSSVRCTKGQSWKYIVFFFLLFSFFQPHRPPSHPPPTGGRRRPHRRAAPPFTQRRHDKLSFFFLSSFFLSSKTKVYQVLFLLPPPPRTALAMGAPALTWLDHLPRRQNPNTALLPSPPPGWPASTSSFSSKPAGVGKKKTPTGRARARVALLCRSERHNSGNA